MKPAPSKRCPIGLISCDILYQVEKMHREGWGNAATLGRLHIVLPEHKPGTLRRTVRRLRQRGLVVYRRGGAVRLTAKGRRWLEAWPEVPGPMPSTGTSRREDEAERRRTKGSK